MLATSRRDTERLESDCYTDLLHLREILKAELECAQSGSWATGLRQETGFARGLVSQRNRNKVMHPARGIDPDEKDFAFIRSVNRDLGV